MKEKKDFEKFLLDNKKSKSLFFTFDVETLTYNKKKGRIKPSKYKSIVYAVVFNYEDRGEVKSLLLPNFKAFFDIINKSKLSKSCKIKLIAHNSNKFDNHFLLHDLQKLDTFKLENLYLNQSLDHSNETQLKNVPKSENTIFEKRVKSKNSLELTFYYDNRQYQTIDNFLKTHTSIAVLGKKLSRKGIITQEEEKTEYNYTRYDKDEDIPYNLAFKYAERVFNQLDEQEKKYIHNDGIILINSVIHYSEIYPSFDYNQVTMTRNVLNHYLDNKDEANYQLLKKLPLNKVHIKYTDYIFRNINLYDYLKHFYKGGLNFYNDTCVGKIIKGMFSMDINSSYPYIMYHYKVPTFLIKACEVNEKLKIPEFNNDYYHVYEIDKDTFNLEILTQIKSKNIRKMLVKYYSNMQDSVYINDFTFKILREIAKLKIDNLEVLSYCKFKCEYFASRDKIAELYAQKTQGKNKFKIKMKDPFNYEITKEINENPLTDAEIDLAKVLLNGLYGLPALKSHFNLFERIDGQYTNLRNGYENKERNIVFASFVTAGAFYNLIEPLASLTANEIDDYLIYTDTDSLYLKNEAREKIINHSKIDKIALGAWDIEHDNIEKFFINNHKKYCFFAENEIQVRSGGLPHDSFNLNMSFEDFTRLQFSNGTIVNSKRSIMNESGTITIYPTNIMLETGGKYPLQFNKKLNHIIRKNLDELRESLTDEEDILENTINTNDILYIESTLGTFSQQDLNPVINSVENKKDISSLIRIEDIIYRKFFVKDFTYENKIKEWK